MLSLINKRFKVINPNYILAKKRHFFQTLYKENRNSYRSFKNEGYVAQNRKFWYIVGAASLAAGAYYVSHLEYVPVSNRRRFNDVSPQMEKRLSQQTYSQIMRQYRGRILPHHHPISRRVQQVMTRLIRASKLTDIDWEIHVIDDPQRNAFILPGGKVFVFSGILPICKNEDGLAVVLAHETAHQIAHHSAEKLSFTKLVLFGYFIISFFYDPSILSRAIIDLCLLKPNSRKLETEADYIGLILMSEACYNPNEAPRLWKRMSLAEKTEPPKWLSTHPTHENRITKINQWIPEAYNKFTENDCFRYSRKFLKSIKNFQMKREEASKPIELSYLIAKEGKNTNNNENTKDYEKYLTFINNKETISNEKRQWIVKIILFILIANFSIGAWYFENIFRTGIHVIHEELKRGNLKFILASYMLVYSLIPIIFSLIIKKHDIYIFPTYITGVIFLGHCLCVIAMFLHKKYFIFLGLFISSLCINPLVILQKILVIEIFQQDKLGFFISIILSIEKMIKFLSFSRSDFNKNQIYDINISFIISSTLSFFSFLICIIYSQIMKNMKVSYILPKKKDVFKNIETMSVYFWWYLLICFLCSCIWYHQ
ncbi:hypothetical protein PORY_001936 [Pneumocystis oryctolagi]|uniref:Uncharacterized protein n=1 Tax=Pneumocystis oryctolagi TaxID=42067 RepID=A0ACB7CAF7_9ASCO|nr:hypothetical protein PORY_001936 [Pneumocystis oryctolagi]